MDPITGALIAAIAAGATQVGKSAVVDSYNGLKALIKRKFTKTDLPAAIENLEKKPDSKSRQRMVQEEVFRQMIRLACDTGKPLLLHNRETTGRLLEILREEQADRVGGILHAFSGSLETASALIRLGFALGIGGIITYPEARRLPGIIDQLPAEWLVLETDAPDMPPHPRREQANRPENLLLVAEKLAALRGWSLSETAEITTNNARRVLHLD